MAIRARIAITSHPTRHAQAGDELTGSSSSDLGSRTGASRALSEIGCLLASESSVGLFSLFIPSFGCLGGKTVDQLRNRAGEGDIAGRSSISLCDKFTRVA